MLSNLTKEIVEFSLIPVVIVVIIDLIVFFIMRKKSEEEQFSFNYFIKVSLIVAIAFVISLIGGYDIWIVSSYLSRGILLKNILYVSLILFLWLGLFIMLIWLYRKALKELKEKYNAC